MVSLTPSNMLISMSEMAFIIGIISIAPSVLYCFYDISKIRDHFELHTDKTSAFCITQISYVTVQADQRLRFLTV